MGQSPSTSGKSLPLDYIYDTDGQTVLKRTKDGRYESIGTVNSPQSDMEENTVPLENYQYNGTEITLKGNKRQNAQLGDVPPKKKEIYQFATNSNQEFNNPNHVVPSPTSSTPSPVQLAEWQQHGFYVISSPSTPDFEPFPPTPPPRNESIIKSKQQMIERDSVSFYQ